MFYRGNGQLKKIISALLLVATILISLRLINDYLLNQETAIAMTVLAHRGVHQTFELEGITDDTCTASKMLNQANNYIENTIPSIQAAFNYGADIVEMDIHLTKDLDFIVFHDWELGCRTNGEGEVRHRTVSYLKSLDVGYGYTIDGEHYPFRGKGIGMMPTLKEVLSKFPEQKFMLHMKSQSPKVAEHLNKYLSNFQLKNKRLIIQANGKAGEKLREIQDEMLVFSKQRSKQCMKDFVISGWFGYMPSSCKNNVVAVPINYGWAIWGWPNSFVSRMAKVNTLVFAVGEFTSGVPIRGLDSLDSLSQLPTDYKGGVFTNKVELIGPYIKKVSDSANNSN
jgi:glycerophosphoryl diester phosphodiesterase